MRYKFFYIPVQNPEGAEQELNKFCGSHCVATMEKHFVNDGQNSFWSICVSFIEPSNLQHLSKRGKIDYREVLNEADFAVFAKLRSLRKTLAEKEGVPAYALFTNDQLAQMVTKRIITVSALQGIKGIGKSRVEKYGEKFLLILKQEYNDKGGSPESGANEGTP